jgi:uncharacterized protein (TIGR02231 family)
MIMKFILMMAIALGGLSANAQQDTAKANATMNEATVYFGYGAELTHKAKVMITKNTKFIVINQLSTQMDINSLQINCPENVSLLSQQFTTYQPEVKPVVVNALSKKIQDSIKQINKAIAVIENKIDIEETVLDRTEKLITSTIATSGSKTALTAEVLKLIEFYNAKIEKNKKSIFDYQQGEIALQEQIEALNQRLVIAQTGNTVKDNDALKSYGRIIMQVVCRTEQEVPIALSYYTNNAGWQPIYDIRVNSKTNDIKLVYKASITQNTGINWRDTKLTLSTGTPNFTASAPLLNTWYLQLYAPQLYNALEGRLPGLQIRGINSIQGIADDKNMARSKIVEQNSAYKYEENNIDPSTLDQYTNMKESLLNTNFEIELPYDIESNGLAHSINIKEENVQSTLKNYAVPKLDGEAYLLAELTNWQNLDLIPGNANIIMDNTYIGRSFIDPNTTIDTLNLSLGKDKRVAVKRLLVKDATATKNRDDYTEQTFTYELTVKNNKLKEMNMLLKDQYPMSNVKEIVTKLTDNGGAIVNTELGVLTWKVNLKPGESKKYRFTYTVKYPKDKKIANLK